MRATPSRTQPGRLACLILLGAGLACGAPAGEAVSAHSEVFAPGVISGPANDAAATFSPDGRTVYFFRSNGEDYDIMVSRRDEPGR